MAQKNRTITSELIFHRTDQGIQYACNEFKSLLDKNPIVIRSTTGPPGVVKGIVGIMLLQRAFASADSKL